MNKNMFPIIYEETLAKYTDIQNLSYLFYFIRANEWLKMYILAKYLQNIYRETKSRETNTVPRVEMVTRWWS